MGVIICCCCGCSCSHNTVTPLGGGQVPVNGRQSGRPSAQVSQQPRAASAARSRRMSPVQHFRWQPVQRRPHFCWQLARLRCRHGLVGRKRRPEGRAAVPKLRVWAAQGSTGGFPGQEHRHSAEQEQGESICHLGQRYYSLSRMRCWECRTKIEDK